jgi:hypothetical protein
MTSSLGPQPPHAHPAARNLAAIAAELAAGGIACHLDDSGDIPSLTIDDPASPAGPTVIIDPGDPAGPGPWIDCTWTPIPGTTAENTAAMIIAVLAAIRPAAGYR